MISEFQKSVGKRIQYIRKQKKISQERLSELIGVSEKTISHWETGSNAITFGKIPLIAKALGVPVYKLFIFSDCETEADELKNLLESLTPEEQAIAKSIINLVYISK